MGMAFNRMADAVQDDIASRQQMAEARRGWPRRRTSPSRCTAASRMSAARLHASCMTRWASR